jgi:YesN/AraC family two-component response regulator
MLVQEHIGAVIEKFYLCTQLPIRSVDFEGITIHSAGYSAELNKLFENRNIYEKAKKMYMPAINTTVVTITCQKHLHYTVQQICGKNIYRGFHFIGPYTSNQRESNGTIVYKPMYCIPYLLNLLRTIAIDSPYMKEKVKSFREHPYSLYIKKALDYIDARYSEPITLEEIARYLKISKSYLCNLLKKETGKTFSQFLNELRIEKSKKLLKEETLPVLDIALAVGFNNQTYYNLVFKKLMHRTPLEFRKAAVSQ